jgi:hypothetical protein
MSQFSRLFASLIVCSAVLASAQAQTATVIPANEAAAHVNEWATVEGVVAKGFTSKSGNTLLNIGAAYPNQTFTGWILRLGPVAPHFEQMPWNLSCRLTEFCHIETQKKPVEQSTLVP